jgi:hypothetical protein
MHNFNESPTVQPTERPNWTTIKPVAAGAYWVRGFNGSKIALVEVKSCTFGLGVNLHQYTTETDDNNCFLVERLQDAFEWPGPLYQHTAAKHEDEPC